jgi:hypothetical protein
MTNDTKAIITGTVRTLAQLVPLAGGAVAQAWSEYESYSQTKRTEAFFTELAAQLRALESAQTDLKSQIGSMPDAAELLERSVAAAKRETSDAKRQTFSRLYSSFLAAPQTTTPDERIDIIHHVEQLTEADLNLLLEFMRNGGTMRGDTVTGTTNTGFSQVGQQAPDGAWLQKYGHIVHSIAKLESRGLLYPAVVNAGFQYSGEAGSSFNIFRQKAWRITPIAVKLINSIQTSNQQ